MREKDWISHSTNVPLKPSDYFKKTPNNQSSTAKIPPFPVLVTYIKDAGVQKEYRRDEKNMIVTQKFRNHKLCHYECCEDRAGLTLTSLLSLHRFIFTANSTTNFCL